MLQALGCEPGDLPEEELPVWPENWLPLKVFLALQTQWAVGGMGDVIGLRYEALPAVLDLLRVKKRRRREVFAGLRVMEDEVLQALNSHRNEA